MDVQASNLVDMVAYLRTFSILISRGVSLIRSMDVMTEQIATEALREAHLDCMRRIRDGETLSGSMRQHPEVFPVFVIGLVRAGEVGGVLDETLERTADFYERQLRLRRERYMLYTVARVLGPQVEAEYEAALAKASEPLLRQYFCYMLGTMLAAGVPVIQAMQTAAELLAEHDCAVVTQAIEAIRQRQSAVPSLVEGGFPSSVTTLFSIGEETGLLDRMAIAAGDLLGVQIEAKLQQALGFD